jgi:hypothetical protein
VNYHVVLHTVCPTICVQNKDIITVSIIKTFKRPGILCNWEHQIKHFNSNNRSLSKNPQRKHQKLQFTHRMRGGEERILFYKQNEGSNATWPI